MMGGQSLEMVLVDASGWICFFARRNFPEIKEWLTILLKHDRVAIVGPIESRNIQT